MTGERKDVGCEIWEGANNEAGGEACGLPVVAKWTLASLDCGGEPMLVCEKHDRELEQREDDSEPEVNHCPISYRHQPHDACDGKPEAPLFWKEAP